MKRTLIYIMCLIAAVTAVAQEDTRTRIFSPDYATLKVQRSDDFLAPAILELDDSRRIIISFDLLGDDAEYLEYSLVHCNADWQPSDLLDSEFLDGFNVAKVDDWAFSINTFEHYVNYRIEIPNEQMRPLLSGNYLLQVYPEGQRDDVLLQARFSVDESRVRVAADVTTSTDRGVNTDWQQLSLRIDPASYTIRDPFNDLIVVVEQNEQPAQTVTVKHPQRVWSNEVIYEHIQELIFPALNEYRRFETVRADYPGIGVDSVRYGNDERYHAYLRVDQPLANHNYLYDQTQYGRYLVREYNSTDSDLSADYVTAHFALEFPQLMNADMYVVGEFCHNLIDDANRMVWNEPMKRYELALPLKQGSYNYQYVAVPRKGGVPSFSLVDGDKYETSNRYDIRVYQREPAWRADRLIGSTTIFSNR